jgi:hypothetical protein
MNTADPLHDLARRAEPLLQAAGLVEPVRFSPLAGGRNNRVFRVDSGERVAVLKIYFQSGNDPRDRFAAERRFYAWIKQSRIGRTPVPLGWNEGERFGLLEWIEGKKAERAEPPYVSQALAFLRELNSNRTMAAASALSDASEACFSIAEHLACINQRVARLARAIHSEPMDSRAAELVERTLAPLWKKIKHMIEEQSRGLDCFASALSLSARCLSPSDFGFHNALVRPDGQLRFFDFEYAGWDDPAKLICDFFSQPRVPVPLSFWGGFMDLFAGMDGADRELARRARQLLPAYRLKWCCIMLNHFAGPDRSRRLFASAGENIAQQEDEQLEKAARALRQLESDIANPEVLPV